MRKTNTKKKEQGLNARRGNGAADKARVTALAQAGRLQDAKSLCARICKKNSKDSEAWFLLGAINGHLNNFTEAAACCRKAVTLEPRAAVGHYNLGIALQQTGEFESAEMSFRETVRLQPDFAEAHHDLGNALQAQGQVDNAIASYRSAISLQPRLAPAWCNLARAYQTCAKTDDAISAYRTALTINPALADASLQLAELLAKQQHLGDAIAVLREALRVTPASPQLNVLLGNLLQRQDNNREAIDCYHRALTVQPGAAEIHFNLGNAQRAIGALDDALSSYHAALEREPNLAPALNNIGLVHLECNDIAQAIDLFQQSLRCDDTQTEARVNLSQALRDSGDIAGAISPLREILARNPDNAQSHWDLALLLLQAGDFSAGWQEYEWRLHDSGVPQGVPVRRFPQARWEGEDLDGKTVLVHAEQGVGDEIMFASCYREILARAAHLVIDCDPRLSALFQRSFPAATVHGGPQNSNFDWTHDMPAIDLQVPAGSLPLYLRPELSSFPDHNGYLVADQLRVSDWQQRLDALGPGLKIGISWRGGHISKAKKRSTLLTDWGDILRLPGACFINLQYGDCSADIENLKQTLDVELHDWEDADALKDLDGFAAQIATLDLVVSVDNSTAHIAGALNVPTLVLQPFAPDWRWLHGRDNSYWYPSVRHLRQQTPGDWSPVLASVREKISAKLRDQ